MKPRKPQFQSLAFLPRPPGVTREGLAERTRPGRPGVEKLLSLPESILRTRPGQPQASRPSYAGSDDGPPFLLTGRNCSKRRWPAVWAPRRPASAYRSCSTRATSIDRSVGLRRFDDAELRL